MVMKVVMAYWPCKLALTGALTVYAQQQLYFNQHDNDQCSRESFIQELMQEVEKGARTWRPTYYDA